MSEKPQNTLSSAFSAFAGLNLWASEGFSDVLLLLTAASARS